MGQPGQLGSQFMGDDAIIRRLQDVERALRELAAADILATAGIGVVPDGVLVNGLMEFKRADGTLGVKVDPATGTFTAYNAAGTSPVARFGSLLETAPGSYGVEVLVGSTWVRLGNQTTTWDSVSGKPATFPPSSHTHVGADITSGTVPQADGSQYGWTNNVAGTEFYALWVGNDGGFHFGRNTSSIRYKENVRAHDIDPARVLALKPVRFDRKPKLEPVVTAEGEPAEGPELLVPGAKGEFGLIAEQVAESFPELVSWFDGEIDSVRYDLLAVGLLSVAKRQQSHLDALTAWASANGYVAPAAPSYPAAKPASGAPAVQPAPLPYTIQEN